MQLTLFRKDQKVHHHILSAVLVSLLAANALLGIDHMLAASTLTSKKLTLKVSKGGNGNVVSVGSENLIDCGKKCSSTVEKDTSVTLIARAAEGHYFRGWANSECRSKNTRTDSDASLMMTPSFPATGVCTVSVGKNSKTVTALFSRLPRPTATGVVASGEVRLQACKMDAKICPDGSTVGRTGPKCEFVCPEARTANPPRVGSGLTSTGRERVEPILGGSARCQMDAKICPDGSTVGRTGPKCEFVCPERTPVLNSAPVEPVIDTYPPLDPIAEEMW